MAQWSPLDALMHCLAASGGKGGGKGYGQGYGQWGQGNGKKGKQSYGGWDAWGDGWANPSHANSNSKQHSNGWGYGNGKHGKQNKYGSWVGDTWVPVGKAGTADAAAGGTGTAGKTGATEAAGGEILQSF